MVRCPRCHHRLRGGQCTEHGPPTHVTTPAPMPLPPTQLPGWRQLECLAIGGSASVFAAVAADDGRAAVVKWARWRDAAAVRRFAHEAALLRRAGPRLVPRVDHHAVVGGWPCLVLERLSGVTLAHQLAHESPDDSRAAATPRLTAIAHAIAALHGRGVVHADLKPENLFLDGGEIRLIDLGLAVAIETATPSSEGGGTLHYTAPEQLAGHTPVAASDVYALGVIGFELVTGRPPFVGDRPAIEYGHTLCRPPRASELVAIGQELDDLLAACLAKDPAARPTLAAVTEVLARTPGATRTTPTASPARRVERGPAALVWIGGTDRVQTARIVNQAAGRIVRERCEGTLAAFLWHDHDDPVRAALTVARKLAPEASLIVHTGDVQIRRSGTRVQVHGELADHPERWCPAAPWSGLLLTAAASDHLAVEQVGAGSLPGFHPLREADRPARSQIATVPALIARHGLVGQVLAAVEAALTDDGPQLVTLTGGGGSGKSRTLAELRHHLAGRQARVVDLAGHVGVAGRPTVAPALAAALAELPGLSTLDRLRRAVDGGVVVLVDDAHRVEDEVLDLLETATGWEQARLAVVVAGDPGLVEGRPRWGARAARHVRFELRPLPDAAAHALLRRQLAPARRIPDALITRLAERARGNPGALVAMAREIHRRGLVRRLAGGDDFHIAADELDFVSLEPDRRWRGARQLAGLPAGMPALMQLCAVLGTGFDHGELEAAARVLPPCEATIDPHAGTSWLARHGLLSGDRTGWTVADAAVGEAALDQLAPAQRTAIHAAALAHCRGDHRRGEADRLGRIAHHARGAGAALEAAAAFLVLAGLARRAHAYVEAERMATHAVEVLGDRDPLLTARALAERGRARRPMALYEGARDDLQRARVLAAAGGDRWLEVETLIDEGAICDFTDRLVESAEAIERAAALAGDDAPAVTRARVDNWLGVVRARQGRLDDASGLLARAIAAADALDDHETAVGAMLMLGGVLRRAGRLDEARATLDRAILRSEHRGDVFHVTVGLFNRINVWRLVGASSAAEADCARAIEIAERHGYGQMEIAGWLNLSEVCLAAGRDGDALVAARRGFAAARRRFGKRTPVVATTWLAMLEAGHHHLDLARGLLDEIDAGEAATSPLLSLRRAAVEVATGGGGLPLDELVAATASLEDADRMSFVWLLGRLS